MTDLREMAEEALRLLKAFDIEWACKSPAVSNVLRDKKIFPCRICHVCLMYKILPELARAVLDTGKELEALETHYKIMRILADKLQAHRDQLKEALEYVEPALPVLATVLKKLDLDSHRKARDMHGVVLAALEETE